MDEPNARRDAPRGEGVPPTPGVGPPPPAARPSRGVVTRARDDLERLRRRQRLRAWVRSLPFLIAATLLHLAVALWLYFQVVLPFVEEKDRLLRAEVLHEHVDVLEEPPPEVPLEPPPEPDVLVPLEDVPAAAEAAPEVLGPGASYGGPGGDGTASHVGIVGVRPGEFGALGGGTPFERFVDDVRARGLDVVFVVDATGSMQRFIERVRAAVGSILSDLSEVVPSVRLGLVAYRDLGDPWITQSVDLTDDRFSVHNFLLDLDASGGRRATPDFEEAVEVGLALAADSLSWRPEGRRVIILMGDAPYHDEDRGAALTTVREFARDVHSVVNTIYVGGDASTRTENQVRARDAFALIARTGGGASFEFAAEDPAADQLLRERVLQATFGPEWQRDVTRFLERAPQDPRQRSVQRHVDAGNRKWLVRRLSDDEIHPAVVDGVIALFDPMLARVCYDLLADESRPRAVRSAGLYVLKRAMDSVAGLPLDMGRPLAEQPEILAAIRRRVEDFAPTRPQGVVAPPPAVPRPVVPPPPPR